MAQREAAYLFWWFFLAFLVKADGLMCYSCESTKQPKCGQYFDKYAFTADECQREASACALQRMDITVSSAPVVAILRGCYQPSMIPGLNSSNGCRWFTQADKKGNYTALYCFCDTDRCNHAHRHVTGYLLVGAVLLTNHALSTILTRFFS